MHACVRVCVTGCKRRDLTILSSMNLRCHHSGGLDQLADRSLRMREVRGSKPRFSILAGKLSRWAARRWARCWAVSAIPGFLFLVFASLMR